MFNLFLQFKHLLRIVFWRFTSLSTISQLHRGGQFNWWRKLEYLQKPQTTVSHWQTLSHNVVSSIHRHEWDSNSQL